MAILNYLAAFQIVSQTLNISVAAKELGVSQPALSRQLRRLEESLGLTLFVRRQRGIELTEGGQRLAQSIGPALTALDKRLQLLREQSASKRGKIRIGSLAEIGRSFVLPSLLSFKASHPEVECELILMKNGEILEALGRRDLDFGIVASTVGAEGLRVSRLGEERSIMVTRASNLQSLQTAGDVLASSFVAYRQEDPLLREFLKRHFPGTGRKPIKPHLVVNDHRCMIEALLCFDHFAVMPAHSVRGYLETGSLRNASGMELNSTIWLARPEDAKDSLVSKAFSSLLLQGRTVADLA